MKGRYGGCHMTIYGAILPGAASIARWAHVTDALSSTAKQRLKTLDWHRSHGQNISLTARRFGLTRYTVRQWQKRFKQIGLLGLNDRSRRPKRLREPTTPWLTVATVEKLRKKYPAWSKYKLRAILIKQGITVSASTIGRILKRRGLIDKRASRKRQKAALRPKVRFPRGFKVSVPGDMVQMDTKHVNLIEGRKLYQFTAIDVLTKTRTLRYYPSLSSRHGADFLNYCQEQFPFAIKAVQTDNGPEFLKDFRRFCETKGLPHYYIDPHTPKQNTYVENSHGSDEKEFYRQGVVVSSPELMQTRLKEWEQTWNQVRPHEALDYLTPQEYLEKWQQGRLPTKAVITLQT